MHPLGDLGAAIASGSCPVAGMIVGWSSAGMGMLAQTILTDRIAPGPEQTTAWPANRRQHLRRQHHGEAASGR
ncbi:hypothetical protein [Paracoccus mutanolyticus]|uniref:hypothetical protein n=1 Tax=Paracoccus mutanolyticus TaxID=1499308 RepID=UPI001CB92E98|nr:hypothetical protein [Paracoccus mutanolyticus]